MDLTTRLTSVGSLSSSQLAMVSELEARATGENTSYKLAGINNDGEYVLASTENWSSHLRASVDTQPSLSGFIINETTLQANLSILAQLILSGEIQASVSTTATLSTLIHVMGRVNGLVAQETLLSLGVGFNGGVVNESFAQATLGLLAEFLINGSLGTSSSSQSYLSQISEVGGELSSVSNNESELIIDLILNAVSSNYSFNNAALETIAALLLGGGISSESTLSGTKTMDMYVLANTTSASEIFAQAWLDLVLAGNLSAASQLEVTMSDVFDKSGYLTTKGIQLVAALDGKPELKAALEASLKLKPE